MENQNNLSEEVQAKLARLVQLEAKEEKQKEYQKRLAAKNAVILRKAKEQGITANTEEVEAYLAA